MQLASVLVPGTVARRPAAGAAAARV